MGVSLLLHFESPFLYLASLALARETVGNDRAENE
jgi:hypothetical protein